MKGRNILVVDDLGYILLLFRKGLTKHGFNVIGAQTSAKAREALGSIMFDIAIIDIHLQESDGLDLIRWIKQKFPEIQIIAMSGKFSEEQIVALDFLGVVDMVAKPIDMADIRSRLDHILGRGRSPFVPHPPTESPAIETGHFEDRQTPTDETAAPATGPVKGVESGAHGPTIFVLDDDPVTQRFLDAALRRLGYQPRGFLVPSEFLDCFKKESCSAAIVDIFFPGEFGGIETISKLKDIAPELPLLVITGKPMAEAIASCRKLGITEILVKPFEKSSLEERLRKLFCR